MWKFYALCAMHALFLIPITLIWIQYPISFDNESKVSQALFLIKDIGLGLEKKPAPNDLLFVNVTYDNMLIDKYDEFGFPVGNQAITDRIQLAKLFSKFKKNSNHKIIVCDVLFEDPSPVDSLLQNALNGLPNILQSQMIYEDADTMVKCAIKGQGGLINIQTDYGLSYKFKLIWQDTIKTMPVKMYETLFKKKIEKGYFFTYIDGTPALNTYILNLPVRNHDIFVDSTYRHFYDLNQLAMLPDSIISALTKDKIVLIGDFKRDIHETIDKDIAGTLILLNVFLDLQKGVMKIKWHFLLVLFIGYFFASIDVFKKREKKGRRWVWLENFSTLQYLYDVGTYMLMLFLITTVVYFIYGLHINILVFGFYLGAIENIRFFIHKQKEHKNEKLQAQLLADPVKGDGQTTSGEIVLPNVSEKLFIRELPFKEIGELKKPNQQIVQDNSNVTNKKGKKRKKK